MSFWVVGDVHGHVQVVRELLQEQGLIDADDTWTGGDSKLWFVGDFTDRGPDGIGAIDLAMSLQRQAADAGGDVGSLLGNHEVLLLAAERFGTARLPGARMTFWELWLVNGGRTSDLSRLTDAHREWIRGLPPMTVVEDRLLLHADSAMYGDYGSTTDAVAAAAARVMEGDDPAEWDDLIGALSDRNAFRRDERAARWMLKRFGGRRIVHGHTPIPLIEGIDASQVVLPLVYQGGLCVNVDGGLFLGGPGFLHLERD